MEMTWKIDGQGTFAVFFYQLSPLVSFPRKKMLESIIDLLPNDYSAATGTCLHADGI